MAESVALSVKITAGKKDTVSNRVKHNTENSRRGIGIQR